jgi:hypothetical protein
LLNIHKCVADSAALLLYTYVKYTTTQALSGFDINSTATAENQSKYFVPIERSYIQQIPGIDFDSRDGLVYWIESVENQSTNVADTMRQRYLLRQSDAQDRSKQTVRTSTFVHLEGHQDPFQ